MNLSNRKFDLATILIVFYLFFNNLNCLSQKQEEQVAFQIFQTIESKNRYIDNLKEIEGKSYNLPIGIKKIVSNKPVTIAISNAKIGSRFGEGSMYVKIEMPSKSTDKKSNYLIFGAQGIKMSYDGGLVGDVKLMLLSSHTQSLGNLGDITIKGGGIEENSGNLSSETHLTLDCNGDFKELTLSADLTLNRNTFKAANSQNEPVITSFKLVLQDLDDLLLSLNMPSFEIKSAPGFIFDIEDATIDLSDTRSSPNFDPVPEYFSSYFTLPDRNLWKGLYINKFSLTFPSMFNAKDSGALRIGGSRLLIDETGITGDITGENILSFSQGNAQGCPFSVTNFKLRFIANNIEGFGFGGQIGIPFLPKEKPLTYETFISKNEYLFKAVFDSTRNINFLGMGDLQIHPNSILQVRVQNGKFLPTAILDGSMKFDKDGLSMEELVFTKLRLSAEAPHFSVESAKYGGEVKFFNFPISVENINFTAQNDIAQLGFNMKLNLMEGKISACSGLRIITEMEDNDFKFKGVYVDSLKLNKVQLAGFSLDGELYIIKDDPQYGNYFGGDITAKFNALSEDLKVNVKSVFGRKDFRYWYVEGKAKLNRGIPVGPVFLDGFIGGAYYKVQPTGGKGIRAYAPYEDCGLGVKAGVNYYVAQENTISGNALFEMNFSSTGGIRNMMFYGTAEFLKKTNPNENEIDNMFTAGQGNLRCVGESFTSKLPAGSSGSEISKEILSGMNLSSMIAGYITMNYEFTTKTFDANFAVIIDLPGGILRGTGPNGEAGLAYMHCSPQTWFIHVGTPSRPLGLKLGLGPLSLSTKSYLMLGDKLESPVLDPKLIEILKISPKQADYMKFPENIALGKGVAFGSRFEFDTKDLTFLILYARFMAGTGFDVMLQDLSDYSCKGKGGPIGINGWYANGQCYAYLQGELGVKIKLFVVNKKISIIKGSTAALLQARLPNPTWIGGYMAVNLDVLGGLIKANMKMKFSFGDACELVRTEGDYSPLEFPIISDLSPRDRSTDVDVFISPQATFNMNLEEPFDAQDEKGETHTYRIKIEDFYITDAKGQKIEGKIKKGKKMDASFESFEILPPNVDMKASISVNFEELVNGNWHLVTQNGKPARESKSVSFKTGEAPEYIPISNIEYAYPVVDQQNYFKGESNSGYVQLKKGQSYLFPGGFIYKASYKVNERQDIKTDFRYNVAEKNITYTIPSLANRTAYEIAFVALKEGGVESGGPSTIGVSNTIQGEGDETITVEYTQRAAQKITKEGSLKVLNYSFKTSSFNTFEQKISSLNLSKGAIGINQDVHALYLNVGRSYEKFDEAELEGVPSSMNTPLVSAEAILDDSYYRNIIAPLIYNWYPIPGISIENRNVNTVGLPPVRGFYIMDGYMSGNNEASRAIPIVYNLVSYYNADFTELQSKASNMFDRGVNMSPLLPLIQSQFPLIKAGEYKTRLRYIMPGNKPGSEKLVKYIYWY